MLKTKNKVLVCVISLLVVSCWADEGQAACCNNKIVCTLEPYLDEVGTLNDTFDFHDVGWCCIPYKSDGEIKDLCAQRFAECRPPAKCRWHAKYIGGKEQCGASNIFAPCPSL